MRITKKAYAAIGVIFHFYILYVLFNFVQLCILLTRKLGNAADYDAAEHP